MTWDTLVFQTDYANGCHKTIDHWTQRAWQFSNQTVYAILKSVVGISSNRVRLILITGASPVVTDRYTAGWVWEWQYVRNWIPIATWAVWATVSSVEMSFASCRQEVLTLYQPMTHICVMSSHKPISIYIGGLILGVILCTGFSGSLSYSYGRLRVVVGQNGFAMFTYLNI